MQKWEYRTLHRRRELKYDHKSAWVGFGPWDPVDLEAELNRLGAEGWELISVTPRSNLGSNGFYSGNGQGSYPIVAGMTDSELFVFRRPAA